MFAIAFDLIVTDLKKEYGGPYNAAYYEIKEELKKVDSNGLKDQFTYLHTTI